MELILSTLTLSYLTVGLSRSVEFDVLAEIANNAGRAFRWADKSRQLITMRITLGDLLSGNAQYYRTRWEVDRTEGSWVSGSSFVTEMTFTLSGGFEFIVPFKITIP